MDIEIDIEALREDLINYYGTASSFNPAAVMDIIKIEKSSDEELIKIALKNNIDLESYITNNHYYRNK